jgi:hypothetical protein
MQITLRLIGVLLFFVLFINLRSIEAASPMTSTFFAAASIEDGSSIKTASDGDLWPSCWASDDNLYTANGDGKGFDLSAWWASDIAINRISGTLPNLSGNVIAAGNRVGQVWTLGGYNRKPTGMLCIDNDIYVAIQDLNLNFDDAPAASISKSSDYGRTWTWDSARPMFDNYRFTTLMFIDYGKNSVNAIDSYVYVYGLDYNWKDSFTHSVPDPLDLYLARVSKTSILDRSTWQFFTGVDPDKNPTWSPDINARVSVLHHNRNLIPSIGASLTALGQGSIVYNKPLNRYIYSTWTQHTFEFYEASQPWGPWDHFLSKSFGLYPWTEAKHGGYATTIPSKFISEDGKTMWVQSNVCPCGGAGMADYQFTLRKLVVELEGDSVTTVAQK